MIAWFSSPRWNVTQAAVLLLFSLLIAAAPAARAGLLAGTGEADITPPIGTPSAGFGGRMGKPMKGVHDPLLATAVALDNGTKKLVFCGVDHLGMTTDMIREAMDLARAEPAAKDFEIFIGSSHTHCGGGGFMNFAGMGFILAGKFNPEARALYIRGTAAAIVKAVKSLRPARLGVGYGMAPDLSGYRAGWPAGIEPLDDVAAIKVTGPAGEPIAVLFNYAAHPTVLGEGVMEFSADYVGYARARLRELLPGIQPVFFNGAQGDISPRPPAGGTEFERCEKMGRALAEVVKKAWDSAQTTDAPEFKHRRFEYMQVPQANSMGAKVPFDSHPTEINAIAINGRHAFLTIPGELSCIYDRDLKRYAGWIGFERLSILGLTNDAHGYIIQPEAWRHRTYESTISFGGENYGEFVKARAEALLHALEPPGAFNADKAHEASVLTEAP